MRYLLLIYANEQQYSSMTPEQGADVMALYNQYTQDLANAGVLRGGDELQPTFTASTVRVQGGKTLTTDGPFAETKEQLGGYYLIETETLDEAIAWAARCPGAAGGSVEVRPVVDHKPADDPNAVAEARASA